MPTITTTNKEAFTMAESADMARLIFKRFGRNPEAATEAWRRLLENDCSVEGFMDLVNYPEHTPHCNGSCAGGGHWTNQ